HRKPSRGADLRILRCCNHRGRYSQAKFGPVPALAKKSAGCCTVGAPTAMEPKEKGLLEDELVCSGQSHSSLGTGQWPGRSPGRSVRRTTWSRTWHLPHR